MGNKLIIECLYCLAYLAGCNSHLHLSKLVFSPFHPLVECSLLHKFHHKIDEINIFEE